jgi:hypothetical protein
VRAPSEARQTPFHLPNAEVGLGMKQLAMSLLAWTGCTQWAVVAVMVRRGAGGASHAMQLA